ncbi:glycoside hydrolase [Penicillium antarcticum]|uniref:glycoside hydrolase n=1 Tax=Penicillium antarcticum TaxID=416450 RepID=UPI0023A52445|nr:glycoside hydrolase [Penicillium antarcticum]KAJ5295555.1 glycoside hydrolase [Penicillium antarcticum]
MKPAPYPSAGKWKSTNVVFKVAWNYQNPNDCANPLVDFITNTGSMRDIEHMLKLQVTGEFFKWATNGKLASGSTTSFTALNCKYFLPLGVPQSGNTVSMQGDLFKTAQTLIELNRPHYTRDPYTEGGMPAFRIMAALGTTTNRKKFYLLQKAIFGNKQPIDSIKWTTLVQNTAKPEFALKDIKAAIAV